MRWALASVVLVPRGAWGMPPTSEERRRVLQRASQAGFSGIELSPRWFDFHYMTSRQLRELRAEAADSGLSVSGLNLSRCILTRTAQASEHLERLRRSVAVAETLGADVINVSISMPFPPGPGRPALRGQDVPHTEHQRSAELMAEVAHQARQAGISVSVELHDDGLLDSPELCLQFLEGVRAPNVGVNPDLGNLCRGSTPLSDWRRALMLLAPRTICWHIKNYQDGKPAPVWDGDIDYHWAVAIMRSVGYDGWVSLESYWGDLDSPEQDLQYLKKLDTMSERVTEG